MTVIVDDNPDLNALSPQRLVLDGHRTLLVPHTLGSPQAPLSPAQAAAKLTLAHELAGDADSRIFTDPLGYFTEPK